MNHVSPARDRQATAYSAGGVEQQRLRLLEAALRVRGGVADRRQPDAAELVDRAQHVEDDAAAVGGQPRERREPQQAAVAERAQPRRLEVVGRDVVARRAARAS